MKGIQAQQRYSADERVPSLQTSVATEWCTKRSKTERAAALLVSGPASLQRGAKQEQQSAGGGPASRAGPSSAQLVYKRGQIAVLRASPPSLSLPRHRSQPASSAPLPQIAAASCSPQRPAPLRCTGL